MRYLMMASASGYGVPLVFIPGILCYSFSWRNNLGPLSRFAPVYAIDPLNAGYSEHVPDLPADLGSTADRLAQFLDAAGIDAAHLVGSSHGGGVAMTMAARLPQRVKSLVLVAPVNPWSRLSDKLIAFYQTWLGALFATIVPWIPRNLQQREFGAVYGDCARMSRETIEGYAQSWRVPGTTRHILRILHGWQSDLELLERCIPELKMPVLVIGGDCDPVVSPRSLQVLAKEIPQAELKVIRGAGHLCQEECPEAFNAIVEEHLKEFQEERV